MSSWKRMFSVLSLLVVTISLPLTLITIKHQQDLRQRADYDGVTFSANQKICGADRTDINVDGISTADLLTAADAAGLVNQGAIKLDDVVKDITIATNTGLALALIQRINIGEEVPFGTIYQTTDSYGTIEYHAIVSGNSYADLETFSNLGEAENYIQAEKLSLEAKGIQISSLSEVNFHEVLNVLNGTQGKYVVGPQVQELANMLGLSNNEDGANIVWQTLVTDGHAQDLIKSTTTTGEIRVSTLFGGQELKTFNSIEDYNNYISQVDTLENEIRSTGIITRGTLLTEGLASSYVEVGASTTKFLKLVRILNKTSLALDIASELVRPSNVSIFWGCGADDQPIRLLFQTELKTMTFEKAACENTSICKISDNACITCAPEGPTSTPTPTPNQDPTCSSLGQNAYCNQFQCATGDVAFQQSTIDCSDNSASAGVPLLCCAPAQNQPALPDCAGKYGSAFSCQDALSDACMPPNEVKDSAGTTCNTNFNSGGIYACCAPPNTPITTKITPSSTYGHVPPPPQTIIPTPVAPYPCNNATSSCDSQNSVSVTFNWTQQESNIDYEVSWDGSGGSHDAGTNVSTYTYHGFSPNQTFNYQITPMRSGVTGAVCTNQITIGSCNTTTTCASQGSPSKCVSPSFSSGVESCITSDNQPGYYDWVHDPTGGHFSDCSTGVNDQCAVCQASTTSTKIATKTQVVTPTQKPSISPTPTNIPIGQPCTKGATNCQTGSTCSLVDKGTGAPASYMCYPTNNNETDPEIGQPCGAYSKDNASCPAGYNCVVGDCEPVGVQPNHTNVFSDPNTYCANNACGQTTHTAPKDTIQGSVVIQSTTSTSSCTIQVLGICLGGSSTHRLKGATITIDSNITVVTDSQGRFEKSVPHTDTHIITLTVPEGYQLVSPESAAQTFETTGTTWKQDLRAVKFTVEKSSIAISPTTSLSPTIPSLSCDPNHDGKTDNNDLTIIENEWYGGSTAKDGDCNKDGVVNGIDFQLYRDIAILKSQ